MIEFVENLEKNERMSTKVESEEKLEVGFNKWLKKLVGERIYFSELTEEEVYKIILMAAEITFRRSPVLNYDHSYEDAAAILYRNFLQRDKERVFCDNTYPTDEYPYLYEGKGKDNGRYFKWVQRDNPKGFNRMKEENKTIAHFKNLIFTEFKNHVSYTTERGKLNYRLNNITSLDYENENMKMHEKISDSKNHFLEAEEDVDLQCIYDEIADNEVFEGYKIVVNNNQYDLTYGNLIRLYSYLSEGKKVTSGEISKHIINNGSTNKPLGKILVSFKKYLLESGIVSATKYISKEGKEKISYGFTE